MSTTQIPVRGFIQAGMVELDPDSLIVHESANLGRAMMGRYSDEKFKELMTSIKQQGVLQPVLFTFDPQMQPHLRVGFRRVEALKRLREQDPGNPLYATVPAVEINPEAAVDGNVLELLRAAYAENAARKDPSALDMAHVAEQYSAAGLKNGQIAKELHITAGHVTKLRSLLTLPEEAQMAVHRGELGMEAAYELSKKGQATQEAVTDAIRTEHTRASKAQATAGETAEDAGESGDAKGRGENKTASGKAKGKSKTRRVLTRKAIKVAGVRKGKLKIAREKDTTLDLRRFLTIIIGGGKIYAGPARVVAQVVAQMAAGVLGGKIKVAQAVKGVAHVCKTQTKKLASAHMRAIKARANTILKRSKVKAKGKAKAQAKGKPKSK